LKNFLDKCKQIWYTIYNNVRVHFIRTNEYKKLLEHNQRLSMKLKTLYNTDVKLKEHNEILIEENEKLKEYNLLIKERYIEKVEDYYDFLSKIN